MSDLLFGAYKHHGAIMLSCLNKNTILYFYWSFKLFFQFIQIIVTEISITFFINEEAEFKKLTSHSEGVEGVLVSDAYPFSLSFLSTKIYLSQIPSFSFFLVTIYFLGVNPLVPAHRIMFPFKSPLIFLKFLLFFKISWLHSGHMEVPGSGTESEPQLRPATQVWQCWIL